MTDREVTYRYDLSGRLESVEYPSGLTLSYTHDDLGRPYVVNDGTYDRVEDTWKGWLLEKREYANGTYLTHLDDSSQNLSGYGYDAFGRIQTHRWKSSGGTVLAGWAHEYDRLGNKKYSEDLDADGLSDVGNPYAFTGRRLDLESGLMQYRHRYYAPELGRFVSRDPLGYVSFPTLYLYGRACPTGVTDPTGLVDEDLRHRAWRLMCHRLARQEYDKCMDRLPWPCNAAVCPRHYLVVFHACMLAGGHFY
ncbi:MAG: RHS repeat-associated core domain-containing protein [Phycisphaerae bacterium]|nr:RHS repeat-associated core domain-containing protein [Phycisphaerae bacterium]